MNYEIVNLAEKIIVGIAARTNNMDPEIGQVIGGVWSDFFQGGYYARIDHKKNDKTFGIYTDYAGDEMDDYTLVVGCEVADAGRYPDGTELRVIPAGKYAKFIVKGRQTQVVAEFWAKLWEMNLPRAFKCDFEEYQNDNMEQAEVHIYIGLKK